MIVRGIVADVVSGETLPGAHVYTLRDGIAHGAATDADGMFAVDFAPGENVLVTFVGYIDEQFTVEESAPDVVVAMERDSVSIPEFEVIAPKPSNAGWFALLLLAIGAAISSRS